MSRRAFLAGVAALAMFWLGALTPPVAIAQTPSSTLVWGMAGNPRHLNPAVQSGIFTIMPGAQIFASPVRIDANWAPQPYVAESWTFSPDNKILTLRIIDRATFHDGKPITADDVAFSIKVVKDNHPFQAMLANVQTVEAPDARTVVVTMKEPNPGILLALSPPFTPVLPKHVFGDGQDMKVHPANSRPIGSGPYKFAEFKSGEHIVIEKNASFFIKGKPHFDRVVIKIFKDTTALAVALETKEVHFAPFMSDLALVERLATVAGLSVSDAGGRGIGPLNWIAFNTARKPFDDKRVRQAISFAVDREFITKRLHRGRSQIATGPIAPGSPYYSGDVERYKLDLAKAEALLDEAGLKRGADGIRFKVAIDFPASGRENTTMIAEYMKPQLKKVGIDLELRPAADFPSWAKRVGGHDFDMTLDAVFNWGDPVVGVHRTYQSTNIRKGVIWSNTQSYANPQVDDLMAKAAVETDTGKRKALYAQFQRLVVEDAPQAFINVIGYHTVHQAGLKGLPETIWGACSPIDDLRRE